MVGGGKNLCRTRAGVGSPAGHQVLPTRGSRGGLVRPGAAPALRSGLFATIAVSESNTEAGVESRVRAILPLMGQERTPERSIAPADVTVLMVTVTVVPPVRDRSLRRRLTGFGVLHGARIALAVALALAALGAIIAAELQSSRTSRPVGARRGQAHDAARAAIAAAFGYPYVLRCLTITISASDPDYARANVDRTNGCAHYRGYINASFHRVDGRWRLVLDEGQPFVPNGLLAPCRAGRAGCARASGRAGGTGSQPRTVGSGVGAASGYALGCLSLSIALHDPRFARADFDHMICKGRDLATPASVASTGSQAMPSRDRATSSTIAVY
jgi:hypothetical protein